jgi:hypothetical protein
MPNKLRIDAARSELSSVEELLQQAISYGDPVGELQFKYKKSELESELKDLLSQEEMSASVALFFGGKPVFGSRGINADFAGKALSDFQDIIFKFFASLEFGQLGSRGKTAFTRNSQLMITQVAKGSFGFILDELSEQLTLTESSLKVTVEKAVKLIEDSAAQDQTNFDDSLKDLDHRTLVSLKNFFIDLDKNDATIRLVEGEKDFQLDEQAIKRARNRTENTSIDESTSILTGELLGLLPEHKRFEFKVSDGKTIIGTCSSEAAETYQERINSVAPIKNCEIEVVIRKIKPINRQERTIYRLVNFLKSN